MNRILMWISLSLALFLSSTEPAHGGVENLKPLFVSQPRLQALISLQPDPTSKSTRTAQLNPEIDLSEASGLNPNSRFELNLFPDANYRAVVIRRSKDSTTGGLLFTGTLEGIAQSQFLIAINNNRVAGSVFVTGRGLFKFLSNPAGDIIVTEIDPTTAGRCGNCVNSADDSMNIRLKAQRIGLMSVAPEQAPSTTNLSVIDVMVVYTPEALTGAGGMDGMNSLIDLGIAEANAIYQNSDASARFRLVYRGLVNYAEHDRISTNLNRLKDPTDLYLDEVHGLRQTNQADLVCMITEHGDAAQGLAGLAFTMSAPSAAFAPFAFSVVQRSQAIGTFTFAHELSHNMGCQHDREHAKDATGTNLIAGAYSYSYGYRFTAGGVQYRTLMAYEPGVQIPYLSSPLLRLGGVPVGIPAGQTNEADNTSTVTLNAPIVSAFFGTNISTKPPQITLTSPSSNSINIGGNNLTLSVNASDSDGSIKQVEYYADYTFLGALTNAPYSMVWSNLQPGEYVITARAVDNRGASSAAIPYHLTVRPVNDAFANAVTLTGNSFTVKSVNTSATTETGEPLHLQNPGGKSVWYKWVSPKAGTVNIIANAKDYVPLVAMYGGTAVSALTPVLPTSISFNTNTFSALVKLDIQAAKTYMIAVDGAFGGSGEFNVSLAYEGPPPNDDFTNRVEITGTDTTVHGNNLFAGIEVGEPSTYFGNKVDKSVWYKWKAPYPGTVILKVGGTNFFALPEVFVGSTVSQLVTGGGTNRTASTDQKTLVTTMTFEANTNDVYNIAIAGLGGTSGYFDLSLYIAPPPTNDRFSDRVPEFGEIWSATGANVNANLEPGETNSFGGFSGGRTIWYEWLSPKNGPVVVSAITTNFYALLDIFTGTNVSGLSGVPGRLLNINTTNLNSTLTFEAVAGKTYYLAVAGYQGTAGPFSLSFNMLPTPANDDFAKALLVTGSSWTNAGSNVNATMESGEPNHLSQTSEGKSIWFRWTAPGTGPVTLTAQGTGFQPLQDVYTGDAVTAITRVAGRSFSFITSNFTTIVKFNAAQGTNYVIALAGFQSKSGNYTMSLVGPDAPPPAVSYNITPKFATNGTNFGFRISGTAGAAFLIESSVDLNNWSAYQTNSFSAGTFDFSDTNTVSTPYRYFRIRSLP